MQQQQRIVVLGAGESGTGAAVLAKKKGLDVFVSDKGKIADRYRKILEERGITYEEGMHTEEKIMNATKAVVSPGIPGKAEIVQRLKDKGIPLISEIEFAGEYLPRDGSVKIIGVTGTNGKTTTTMLTHHLLQKAGLNVGLAGNVGKSLAWQIAEQQHEYYVLELSSFQLDGMFDFRCNIAILTNITPDHLDRYDYDLKNYVMSKFRILQNQTGEDAFIYCADDEITNQWISSVSIKAQQYPFSIKKKTNQGSLA